MHRASSGCGNLRTAAFIVSEYVNGPSLVELVEQFGPRSGPALERIAVATLTALGAVHSVGMVHRDFKPANVLLGPDGPVVIDFGLATVPGMTTTGLSGQVAVGTPAFMSPEQLAAKRVTAAADMWSWGVTIAYAGTGRWSQPVEAIELRSSPELSARRSSANTSAGVLKPSIARGR
ncbi:MAG: protein kinase domain-containing protein, partial [Streptosporangiaceae bacterium]